MRDRDPARVLAALRALPAPVPPAPDEPPTTSDDVGAPLSLAAAAVQQEVLGYLEPR